MTNLRIPGPIPVPDEILQEMGRPMMNHRGPQFKEILLRVTERLKTVYATQGDMYILSSSGTGAMEAAVVNTLSPGDRVLAVTVGAFGDRFAKIADVHGADVTVLRAELGQAADPERIRDALKADPSISAVLVTHNETSTGVVNDLATIGAIVKGEFGKLLLRQHAWHQHRVVRVMRLDVRDLLTACAQPFLHHRDLVRLGDLDALGQPPHPVAVASRREELGHLGRLGMVRDHPLHELHVGVGEPDPGEVRGFG